MGREQKEATSNKIHALRRLEQQDRLKIINYKDGIGLQQTGNSSKPKKITEFLT